MQIKEEFRPGGVFHFVHKRNGKVLDEWDSKNRFVDDGLAIIVGKLGEIDGPPTVPSYVHLGIDGSAWNRTQSGVLSEVTAGNFDTYPMTATPTSEDGDVTNDTYQVQVTFTATGTTNNIQEAALMTLGGICLCRTNFSPARSLISTDTLEVTYKMKLIP